MCNMFFLKKLPEEPNDERNATQRKLNLCGAAGIKKIKKQKMYKTILCLSEMMQL